MHRPRPTLLLAACIASLSTACFALNGAGQRIDAPWRIESFCHRGAPPARRCLIQARQGIIVFRLAEFPAAPAVHWQDGIAALTFGKAQRWRFYQPPQRLSSDFSEVRAYDSHARRVAFVNDGKLHLRAMFGNDVDMTSWRLPPGVTADRLTVRFNGPALQLSWRNAAGAVMHSELTPAS